MQIVLGSQQLKTLTFRQTLNPSYYEAMEMEVILPEMMQLAPDIVVRFLPYPVERLSLVNHGALCGLTPKLSTSKAALSESEPPSKYFLSSILLKGVHAM